jgi:hypothetical protein
MADGISRFVEERLTNRIDRHVDDSAHPEADEDALLYPRIDTPAARLDRGVRLSSPDVSGVDALFERREKEEVVRSIGGGWCVKELFDLGLQAGHKNHDTDARKRGVRRPKNLGLWTKDAQRPAPNFGELRSGAHTSPFQVDPAFDKPFWVKPARGQQ